MTGPFKFLCFSRDLGLSVHNFSAATLKVMLTNKSPGVRMKVAADITEIKPGGGYEAGGRIVRNTSWTQAPSGQCRLMGDDVVIICNGVEPVSEFRWAVMCNAAGPLICWWDRGSHESLKVRGDEFALEFPRREIIYLG